jgi:hypothetical protein
LLKKTTCERLAAGSPPRRRPSWPLRTYGCPVSGRCSRAPPVQCPASNDAPAETKTKSAGSTMTTIESMMDEVKKKYSWSAECQELWGPQCSKGGGSCGNNDTKDILDSINQTLFLLRYYRGPLFVQDKTSIVFSRTMIMTRLLLHLFNIVMWKGGGVELSFHRSCNVHAHKYFLPT